MTAWVDVAIGLSIVYVGASLFVTIVNEYVAQVCNLRGRQLWDSLNRLIADTGVRARLASSPALAAFFGKRNSAGSYVDPMVLARALICSFAPNPDSPIPECIANIPDQTLRTQLQAVVATVERGVDNTVSAVSHWVDASLTMLGEGYKRRLQTISFWLGLCIAAALNLDTVALTAHLYRSKDARDAVVAVAIDVTQKADKATFETCIGKSLQERSADPSCAQVDALLTAVQRQNDLLKTLPMGWTTESMPASAWPWITRLVGWLLTALALSLGAPFWFDILAKLVNVRHGMLKPEPGPAPPKK